MGELWVPIKEFPSYSISSYGRVVNEDTKRPIKRSFTKQGALKVGLVRGGTQYTRSVTVLVAEAFVEGKTDVFNTPIHLDGDHMNNNAENLAWRPRWFAWQHTRQFTQVDKYKGRGPIREVGKRRVYVDVVDAAIMNGLLFEDIWRSIQINKSTFPTWQQFEVVPDNK